MMYNTQNKIQFFCLNCCVFILDQEQHRAHSTTCTCPNIQSIALIPKTLLAGDADKEMGGEKLSTHWPALNVGQMISAGQVMNAGQERPVSRLLRNAITCSNQPYVEGKVESIPQ